MYRLKRDLYGLEQALRAWNKRINGFLGTIGFIKCIYKHGVYVKTWKNNNIIERIIICLYVDDLLVTSRSEDLISCKRDLLNEFEMRDLRNLIYFLGIEFKQTSCGMVLHKMKYVKDLVKKFGILQSNATITPIGTWLKLKKNWWKGCWSYLILKHCE